MGWTPAPWAHGNVRVSGTGLNPSNQGTFVSVALLSAKLSRERIGMSWEVVLSDMWFCQDFSGNGVCTVAAGAADAAREVVERWLLEGLGVSVGHRRCSRDPSSQNDAGTTLLRMMHKIPVSMFS